MNSDKRRSNSPGQQGTDSRQSAVTKVSYAAKEYWSTVAETFGGADPGGLSPVLHPGTPTWFNQTIDRMQNEAWNRGVNRCGISPNSWVLDIGCGTGRWLARYQERQLLPVGLDATAGMLKRAATRNLSCPLVAAVAQRLPFRDQSFSFVSAVTVIQHIPPDEQRQSLHEIARILKPGGHLLLIDLIRGSGPHIFPRSPAGWIAEASSAGLCLVEWHGQEYFVVDRVFVRFARIVRRLFRPHSGQPLPVRLEDSGPKNRSVVGSLYWATRKITCKTSEWLEPVARTVCPNDWATHGIFLFRK